MTARQAEMMYEAAMSELKGGQSNVGGRHAGGAILVGFL
jgi:hypothetical protein